jgi:hypothetical protein
MAKTRYTIKQQMAVPAALRAGLNAALERTGMGFGPDTFSIPMRRGADGPATHYGCSWTMTAEQEAVILALIVRRGESSQVAKARSVGGEGDDFETFRQREGFNKIEATE